MTLPASVFPTGTPNNSATGTLASVNNAVSLSTDGLGSVDFALDGSPVGPAVIFESTSDGGATWIPTKAYQKGGTGAAGSTTASAAGVYNVTVGGAQQVRVRLTAITSGSFSVMANGTKAAAHVGVKNGNAADLNATVVIAATDAQFGTDGAGITQPTGGSGVRGWLSGIYQALISALTFIPKPAVWIDRSGSINGTVLSAAVLAGNAGTGGTNGTATVAGTTGTGTKFQASVTIASGAISAINSITVPGLYTVSPTNPYSEPVTGGGLTGAILNLTMGGVATQVMAANASRRKLEFQPTSATSTDWALNKSGNGVTAAIGAAGSLQIAGMTGNPGRGDIYTDESTAAVFAYNATPFSTFTASEY